jgi:hypothetical protein
MVWLGCIACLKKYYLKLDDLCLIEPSSNRNLKDHSFTALYWAHAICLTQSEEIQKQIDMGSKIIWVSEWVSECVCVCVCVL